MSTKINENWTRQSVMKSKWSGDTGVEDKEAWQVITDGCEAQSNMLVSI